MEWIVWADQIKRGDLQLAPGDIEDSLAWFRDKAGQVPKMIALNPQNEHLADKATGIKIVCLSGVLAWEVWLSSSDNFVTPSLDTDFLKSQIRSNRDKTNMKPRLPLGRPPVDLPIEKILELHNKGLGVRAIANELEGQGVRVSYRTIHRAIKRDPSNNELVFSCM